MSETVRTCGAGACAANCSVFLTTDSEQAQALFAAAMAPFGIPVVASAGGISHLEHSATNASEHMKTFADWCGALEFPTHMFCMWLAFRSGVLLLRAVCSQTQTCG